MTTRIAPVIEPGAAAERLAELITSSWISHAIGAGIDLGVFDALAETPASVEDLAARLDCVPATLVQLLRGCESLELCRLGTCGRWETTPVGALLASRTEGSQQAWARFWCRDLAALWSGLAEAVRHGMSVRSLRGDAPGFGHVVVDTGRADALNRAMTANTWWVAEAFARLPALDDCRHLVDVGGGHGVLLIASLRRRPTLRGTVFDLGHAAAGSREALVAAGVDGRADFIAGDFFEEVPGGADAYVLKSVLHDWPDPRCITILASCRSAMTLGARLFVVERLAGARLAATASDRAWARSDLNMLVAHGACERTEEQFRALLQATGFRLETQHTLAMGLSALEARAVA